MKKIIAFCFVILISAFSVNAIVFESTHERHIMDFMNIPTEIYEVASANEPDLIIRVLNMSSNVTDTLHLVDNIHDYIDFYLNLRNQIDLTVVEEKFLIMWCIERIPSDNIDENANPYTARFPYFILASGGLTSDENGYLVYCSSQGIFGRNIRYTLHKGLSLIVPVTQNFSDDVEIYNVFIMLDGYGATDQSNLSIYFETSDGDFIMYIENSNRRREELNLHTASEFLIPIEDFLVLSELNFEQLQYLNPNDMALGFVVPEIRNVFDLEPFLLDENGLWTNPPMELSSIEHNNGVNYIAIILGVIVLVAIIISLAVVFAKRKKKEMFKLTITVLLIKK